MSQHAPVPAFPGETVDRDDRAAPALLRKSVVPLVCQVMGAGRHQVRSKSAFTAVDRDKRSFLDQPRQEALNQILRDIGVVALAAYERIKGKPVTTAESGQSLFRFRGFTITRGNDHTPARCLEVTETCRRVAIIAFVIHLSNIIPRAS